MKLLPMSIERTEDFLYISTSCPSFRSIFAPSFAPHLPKPRVGGLDEDRKKNAEHMKENLSKMKSYVVYYHHP